MTAISRIVFVTASLLALGAFAHGGVEHLKGTVTKVDGTSITLAPEKGPPVVVATDAKTDFSRGAEKVTLKDIAVGDKAVIHAVEHDEKLLAQIVKLGAPAKAAPDGGARRTP